MRPLPGPSPLPIDSIRVDNEMGIEDYRKIYRALNQKGKLNSLNNWFENVPEEDLKEVARLFSEELYETALERNGLVQILADRQIRKGFSDWKEKNPIEEKKTFWSYLTFADFKNLFGQHTGFFDLDFQKTVQLLPDWAERYAHRIIVENKNVSKEKLAQEIRPLVSNQEFKKETLELFRSLSQKGKFNRLVNALSLTERQTPKAFLAFSNAISLNSPEKLQELFESLKVLDAKPEGLFSIAGLYLKENEEYKRVMAREFQSYINEGIITSTIDSLKSTGNKQISLEQLLKLPRGSAENAPTAEFKIVKEQFRKALVFNFSVGNKETLEEWFNPTLNLYAYLYTKTLEEIVAANTSLLASKPENFWKVALSSKKVKIVLNNSSTGEFNPLVHKDFVALGMQKEEEYLKPQLFNKEIFSSNQYLVESENPEVTLEEILKLSFDKTFALKPLAEPGVVLNMLIGKIDFDSLEATDNLLTLIEKTVSVFSANDINALDKLLFHNLDLHKFTPERLEIFYEMYGNNDLLKDKLTKVFRCLTLLHDLHHSGVDGVSGLYVPWAFLNQLGNVEENVSVFNRAFGMLRESQVFKAESRAPELKKVFENPNLLAKYLYALSQLSEEELELVSKKFNQLNLASNWNLLEKFSTEWTIEFDYSVKNILEQGVYVLPTEQTLTEKERNWLIDFSKSENFKKAVVLFNKYGSHENFHAVVLDLLKLSENGELSPALDYLARIQNDRLRKLAITLKEMDKSNELQALLKLLSTI